MKKQDHDLRQKHQHATGTGDHPIDQQAAQPAGRRDLGHQIAQPRGTGLDPAHGRFSPGKHRLKDEEQQRAQHQRTQQRIEHHAVDAIAEQVRHGLVQTQARQDALHRLMVAVWIGFRATAGVDSDRHLGP